MRPSTGLIMEYIDNLPEGSLILDVGCGSGRELKRVMEKFPKMHFFGIDSENSPSLSKLSIDFKVGDFEKIGEIFPDKKFDVIICQHVIEHIVYPENIFKVFKNVLKMNGRIFLETPSWTRLFIPFHRDFFWNDPSHVRPYTKKSLRALCKSSGFVPIEIKLRSALTFYLAFKNFLKSKDAFDFFKRFFDMFVSPFLKENIILIATLDEK